VKTELSAGGPAWRPDSILPRKTYFDKFRWL
jgi:hypothetical protein